LQVKYFSGVWGKDRLGSFGGIESVEPSFVADVSRSRWILCETKSNSNSLANQLGIHIILAKQEKLASNSVANQLGKNRNLAKLTSLAIVVSL
jgi:hypothetical protein